MFRQPTSTLTPGTAVATIKGDILMRRIEHVEQPLKVFNLSIANTPSYFAGEDGLWVHNANIDCNLENSGQTRQFSRYQSFSEKRYI